MLTHLRIQNFKSWRDTEAVRLGRLTGIFGTNSSGKTSLLQFLLLLKQTAESQNRARVLQTGDEKSYVDLGTFEDLIHGHELPGTIRFEIEWDSEEAPYVMDFLAEPDRRLHSQFSEFEIETLPLSLSAEIEVSAKGASVTRFAYRFADYAFGMQANEMGAYGLVEEGHSFEHDPHFLDPLSAPVKFYGFPIETQAHYEGVGILKSLVFDFEQAMERVVYLGPLREYPKRTYLWSGGMPDSVGKRGEDAVAMLLAAIEFDEYGLILPGLPTSFDRRPIGEVVGWWLRRLGLIHDFDVHRIAEGRELYEVRVKPTEQSPWVSLTDVGFGVSQVFPVLVLCLCAEPGATLVLEQPEIHLHPSVQAELADLFLYVTQQRGVQIILESHSEHLLRRLQRRIAEEQASIDDVALYFAEMEGSASTLRELDLDTYGTIQNWPKNFFGDSFEDLAAMTEAAMIRKMAEAEAEG